MSHSAGKNDHDTKDAVPGSDADSTPVPEVGTTPSNPNKPGAAPLEDGEGKQKDDNIDDRGNKPDGSKLDQPT